MIVACWRLCADTVWIWVEISLTSFVRSSWTSRSRASRRQQWHALPHSLNVDLMSVRYRCRRARSVRTRCRCLGAGGNALAIATGLGGLRCGEESESEESESEASRLSSNALANIGPRCSCSRTVASPERTRSSAGTRSAFTAILSAGAGAPHPDGIAACLRTSSDRAPRATFCWHFYCIPCRPLVVASSLPVS